MMTLYFVVFREEGTWVAHGLQRSVVTQGKSLKRLRESIELILGAYAARSPESLDRLPAAREEYWEMFAEALYEGRRLEDVSDDMESEQAFALKMAA